MSETYPIELSPPDIRCWRASRTGVDYVHQLDSGRPGPTVLVQALTHGNEICGAIALDWLLREGIKPARGQLIVAFANIAAYERFDPADPNASRYVDEDFNRVWDDETLFGPRDSVELARARELQPFVDAADYLLDIHSMHQACRPIMVCGTHDKGADFARELAVPGDLLIDTGHPAGRRMRDRGGFGDPASHKSALLIECGQHWEASAADVAIDTLVRFLAVTGIVDAEWTGEHLRIDPPARQRLVRVTEPVVAKSAEFRFLVPIEGLSVVPKAGTPIAQDGNHIWLSPYDDTVLVMPSTTHIKPGTTVARLGRYES
ncbi:MAG: succinylglutamate desuccinylase/aspartoacylase family protein [Burkholderiaceae bacterium]